MSAKRFKQEFQDEHRPAARQGATPRHAAPAPRFADEDDVPLAPVGRHAAGRVAPARQAAPATPAPSPAAPSPAPVPSPAPATPAPTPSAARETPPLEAHRAEGVPARVFRPAVGRHVTGSRFARASRATDGAHRFAQLGGTVGLGLADGEVPVTAPTGDVPGGAFATDETPRPIGVDPAVTGSFHTISANQGAVISTRETASHAAEVAREALPDAESLRVPEKSRAAAKRAARKAATSVRAGKRGGKVPNVVIAVAVGIVAIVLVIVVVARLVMGAPTTAPDSAGATTDAQVAQTTVATDASVKLGEFTYSLSNANGAWSFVRTSGDDTVEIAKLSGTPVSLALYNGFFYVAENLPDGSWDVIGYMAADGSVASQLVGSDSQPITGQGTLASSVVDGSNLVLTDDAGSKTAVPLG